MSDKHAVDCDGRESGGANERLCPWLRGDRGPLSAT